MGQNTYCKDNPQDQICQGFEKDTQFKKFIMFVTDGFPIKYAPEVLEEFKVDVFRGIFRLNKIRITEFFTLLIFQERSTVTLFIPVISLVNCQQIGRDLQSNQII